MLKAEDHVRIVQNMVKKSKTAIDVIYLLISPSAGKGRLMDTRGEDVASYEEFIKKSKARLVAMFVIYIDSVMSHIIVTLHDMRYKKRIMVFDNLGGETPYVKFVSRFIQKQMQRPNLVFDNMSTCPITKIHGLDCAYWTLAFFKYMIDHPTGTISGFQRTFSKQMYDTAITHNNSFNNSFLQKKMVTYKKHIHDRLASASAIAALFDRKLTLND